jgi:hypothetical protein
MSCFSHFLRLDKIDESELLFALQFNQFFQFRAKWTWCKANNTKTTFRWSKTSGCTHMLIAVQQPHQLLTYATLNRSKEEDSLPLILCFSTSLYLYLPTSSKKIVYSRAGWRFHESRGKKVCNTVIFAL